jgi:hypothetical protein
MSLAKEFIQARNIKIPTDVEQLTKIMDDYASMMVELEKTAVKERVNNSKWDKLNKELDDSLSSMTIEDWNLWASKRVLMKQKDNSANRITEFVEKLNSNNIKLWEDILKEMNKTFGSSFRLNRTEADYLTSYFKQELNFNNKIIYLEKP